MSKEVNAMRRQNKIKRSQAHTDTLIAMLEIMCSCQLIIPRSRTGKLVTVIYMLSEAEPHPRSATGTKPEANI
jgi:hypothetical protein